MGLGKVRIPLPLCGRAGRSRPRRAPCLADLCRRCVYPPARSPGPTSRRVEVRSVAGCAARAAVVVVAVMAVGVGGVGCSDGCGGVDDGYDRLDVALAALDRALASHDRQAAIRQAREAQTAVNELQFEPADCFGAGAWSELDRLWDDLVALEDELRRR